MRVELAATQQRLAEAERSQVLAEQANQTKTAFLAGMSHEIRTPMTSVLGFAELLAYEDATPDKRRNYVEKILRNSRHLLALIDDVLDLSKVEAGHLMVQKVRFSPALEIAQVLDLLRNQAVLKEINLSFDCAEPLPSVLVNDQLRFRQILLNLVGNAIKFTDHGEVSVTANLRHEEATAQLEVQVHDSGEGIDPSLQDQLFQPFSQVKLTGTRARPGTGLGLALARNIARALGGDVLLLNSTVGQGSTFVLRLPLDMPGDERA